MDKVDSFPWKDDPTIFYVFFRLLFKASYKDHQWRDILVKRGQVVTSYSTLSNEFNLSVKQLRRAINKLHINNFLDKQMGTRFSVITICNYDSWVDAGQNEGKQKGKLRASEGQTEGNTEGNTYNKDNKDNKEKEEDTNVSKKKTFDYPEEYEKDFILYGRKGSKKNGFKRWSELTENDKAKMRKHIPYYLQSNDRQYLKDFEGYINQRLFESPVYKGSELLFDPVQLEFSDVYSPKADGVLQWWDDKEKCLHFNGYLDMLDDGYTNDNRPDGAKVKWQMYSWIWSADKKEWSKQ